VTEKDARTLRKRLFADAAELPTELRGAYLDRECPAELRAELDDLLAFADTPGFLAPEEEAAPTRPATAPLVGSFLGHYRIVREIGAGGMGVVYEAEQERPQRRVALKVVHGLRPHNELAQRFAREAELLGRLRHPGIARIYEAGVDEKLGVPFLAMEYIEGPTLTAYARDRALDDRARLQLVARIADAVTHAHQKGIIHRDLKPGNILVDAEGQPVVLDFGVARDAFADGLGQTLQGQLVGTVTHMSPEQAAGRIEEIDTRTDVYALGVIAFELLAGGEQPHDTTELGLKQALERIVDAPPRRLESFAPHLRGDVATVVHTALAKERDARYASAADLAADIRRYLRGEPIAARPASAWYQLSRFAARHRTVVALAALALVALVGGTIASTLWALEAQAAAGKEREARSRAERRLDDVQHFATGAVFDIHRQVMALQGGAEAGNELLDLGLDALRRIQAEESDDPELIRSVAQAFVIQGRARGGEMYHQGEGDSAKTCFDEGVRLWRLVRAGDWEEAPIDRARLGLALYHQAGWHLDRRDLDTAADLLTEAAEVLRPAVTRFPGEMDLPGDLAAVLTRLGQIEMQRGRPDQAVALYREGLEFNLESLRRSESPEDRSYHMRGLILSHNWLGNYFRDTGDLERAETEYRRYLDYAEQIHALAPDNTSDRANLAIAHGKLARIARDRGQPLEEVLAAYERAADIQAPLTPEPDAATPNFARIHSILCAENDVLWCLLHLDQLDEASARSQRSAWMARELLEKSDQKANWAETCLYRGWLDAAIAIERGGWAEAIAALDATRPLDTPETPSEPWHFLHVDRCIARYTAARALGDGSDATAMAWLDEATAPLEGIDKPQAALRIAAADVLLAHFAGLDPREPLTRFEAAAAEAPNASRWLRACLARAMD